MQKLFEKITYELSAGRDAVLVSIIASSGSTPRGSGAKMALFNDGTTFGTIGGGAVEYQSIERAKRALRDKQTFTAGFNLTHNETADIGMICGGSVTVYFQYVSGEDPNMREMFKYAAGLFEQDTDSWLITEMTDGAVSRMYLFEHGKGVLFADEVSVENLAPMLCSRAVLEKGTNGCYVEPLTQAGTVYVFGGGHVAQQLVPILARIGFKMVVYEDRAEFADPALFENRAQTLVAPFTELSKHITLKSADYAVIMTRGHQYDYELLEQVLRADTLYVGVIGSRAKIAATNKRLRADGISDEAIERIHTPIGLAIKAETPAEIAISIAAELILCRAEQRER